MDYFDTQVMGSFIEGGVNGSRHDHLGLGNAFLFPRPLTVHIHAVEDAIAAARSYDTAYFIILIHLSGNIPVKHFCGHRNNLCFEFGSAGA